MQNQTSIKECVSVKGISITGEPEAQVTFCPAPPNTGLVFVRRDLPGLPQIKCSLQHARVDYRWTSLMTENIRIEHTEHVLAAISGLEIDNLIIKLSQASVPVMSDYSSKEFTQALLKAGIVKQLAHKKTIPITKPLLVHKRERVQGMPIDKLLAALPYEGFKITYVIDYPDLPDLTHSAEILINPENFINELAGARSFIIESEAKEVAQLTGKASDNVLVIKPNINSQNWLWPNEPARHKALDLLGDLSLLGKRIKGHIIGIRSGHRLNLDLCNKIYEEYYNDSISKAHNRE